MAVYLSLLALAWSSNQPNQLYRLVSNPLKGDMWGLVFGGGVKVVTRPHTGETAIVIGFVVFIRTLFVLLFNILINMGGGVAEWLECWTCNPDR